MHRSALLCVILLGGVACGMTFPASPSPPAIPVGGEYQGTFESSWGSFPVTASLANEVYYVWGNYSVDGQRASGSISGTLQVTDAKDQTGIFYGELVISYKSGDGETCQSRGHLDGFGSPKSLSFSAASFTSGNCPDSPTGTRISLRR